MINLDIEKKIDEFRREFLMETIYNYIATQTETGFVVNLNKPLNNTIEIKNEDFEEFAKKINDNLLKGEEITFSEQEKILFNIWHMLLIPEDSVN